MTAFGCVAVIGAVAILVARSMFVQPLRFVAENEHSMARFGGFTALGAWFRRRTSRPPDPQQDRLVGRFVVILAVTAIVLPLAVPVALLVAVVASIGSRRRRLARRQRAIVAELPELVDLYAVGVQAGLGSAAAVDVIAGQLDGPVVQELLEAVTLQRLGRAWSDVLPVVTHNLGPSSRPFIDAIEAYETQGVAIGEALREISGALRDDQRRLAETAARRLPVQMLLPLIVCVLPAFLVLTVAPIIVDAFSSLSQ